jgi:hypothetical protein
MDLNASLINSNEDSSFNIMGDYIILMANKNLAYFNFQ